MQQKLSEYAALAVRVGINLKKGQTLIISCPTECAVFGRMLAAEAYDVGAREVVVRWYDDGIDRLMYLKADDAVFDVVPAWLKTFYEEYTNPQTAKIAVYATDPENLLGVAPDRIQRWTIAAGTALKKYNDMQMAKEFPWCVVSVPTRAWAAKVFPGIEAEEAVDKLWDAIYYTLRIDGDGTGVRKWEEHLARLQDRVTKLNGCRFKSLIYKNGLGTDLTVELPEKHNWIGGGDETTSGTYFVANMPTEEVFTLPKKDGANGVVYSSMPLVLNGHLIKDIKLTLKDGKIVDAYASEGLEILLRQLDTDEGARYFGEVALVPRSSPISEQGILYYNTLFDENASCHFAFGAAYPAFVGAENMSEDEKKEQGMNDSIIHEDFMVGTPDLVITGITPGGCEIPVFEDGNFVI